MVLLITALVILCCNEIIAEAEDITTMHYPWSPVSHKSDGIVRSYDVSGDAFIKNKVDDYETYAMNTYVGDHEPPDDRNKLSKMSIHCNSYIKMTIQNNSSELPVAEMKMVPSRPHKIFDGGVVMITLNDDVPTNDAYKINVFDTPDVVRPYEYSCNYEVGLCAGYCNYEEATCVDSKAAPASQDWCDTCCTETGITWYDDYTADMKSFPGVMTLDDSYQQIMCSNI